MIVLLMMPILFCFSDKVTQRPYTANKNKLELQIVRALYKNLC